MKILISGNGPFCKTFKAEIPRPQCDDPNKLGRLPLNSHSDQLAWQCSILRDPYNYHGFEGQSYYIAVEANSRICLFIPREIVHNKEDFEHYLVTKIVDQAMIACQLAGIDKLTALQSIETFDQAIEQHEWIKNTDLSVNGAINDMEDWLHACISEIGRPPNIEEFLDLEYFLNQRSKKVKVSDNPVRRKTIHPFNTFFEFWQHHFIKQESPIKSSNKKRRDNVVSLFPAK